jgi:hypothetical protein
MRTCGSPGNVTIPSRIVTVMSISSIAVKSPELESRYML